ncbi:hypothetical protein ACFWH7_04480 [Cellulosimicrobium cellulans]|uniref:hypothetical protein n=1 Tax=Cellulosimicrobium cellulans TaxID=1710 RepID=UPI00365CAA3B
MTRRRVVEWALVAVLVCAWLAWMIVRMVNGESWGWMAGTLVGTVAGALLGAWARRRQERRDRPWPNDVTRP